MVLLFDAANTLIYKPTFYVKFREVLDEHGYKVDPDAFAKIHKVISELYHFPDRTSKEFYDHFNCEVLNALGIITNTKMLDDLFKACSYLPWEKFEDTEYLSKLPIRKAILSNFHNGLTDLIAKLFDGQFSNLIVSEDEKVRKPDLRFFERAIGKLNVKASEIIYIGDSVKLDLEPGIKAGMNAWLIDRNNYYPYCKRRLQSFREIKDIL